MKKGLILWGIFLLAVGLNGEVDARIFYPRFAGSWYPDSRLELTTILEIYFSKAAEHFPVFVKEPRLIIAPHAGFIYSGLCAATAFGALLEEGGSKNKRISKVILLAPSHHAHFEGVALLGRKYTQYQTPLGTIQLDMAVSKQLAKNKNLFHELPEIFETEHAVEIELPFLQHVLQKFSLIPLLVGSLGGADPAEVARILKPYIDEHTLVVVSSDFIHYGPSYHYTPFTDAVSYRIQHLDARIINTLARQTLTDFEAILAETKATVCGENPLRIMLSLLEQKAFGSVASHLSCYYNSLQMVRAREAYGKELFSPEKLFNVGPMKSSENSVSYVGMVYGIEEQGAAADVQLTGYEKKALLKSARAAIENSFLPHDVQLDSALLWPSMSQALSRSSGVFVTLKKQGELRGCIGCLSGCEPRYSAVPGLALSAAYNDTRFLPLKKAEYETLSVEISLLSQPKVVDGYERIIVGTHGVEMEKAGHRAVFLPHVATEQGWDRETMLQHLSLKAGLPGDAWRSDAKFKIFEAIEITEG